MSTKWTDTTQDADPIKDIECAMEAFLKHPRGKNPIDIVVCTFCGRSGYADLRTLEHPPMCGRCREETDKEL